MRISKHVEATSDELADGEAVFTLRSSANKTERSSRPDNAQWTRSFSISQPTITTSPSAPLLFIYSISRGASARNKLANVPPEFRSPACRLDLYVENLNECVAYANMNYQNEENGAFYLRFARARRLSSPLLRAHSRINYNKCRIKSGH